MKEKEHKKSFWNAYWGSDVFSDEDEQRIRKDERNKTIEEIFDELEKMTPITDIGLFKLKEKLKVKE